jgi:putative phage-type endonuclease
MNATLLGTVGQDLTTEDWLSKRREGIGGSDAPALAGAVEWASPMSVYLEKLGLVENDLSDNEAVFWGSRLEGTITDRVEEVTGLPVTNRQGFYAHPELPWMLATVDGITTNAEGEEGLVEIKTTGAWRAKTWKDDVPLHVFVQVQHDLAVTGLLWAIVGVLIGGQKFETHHIARDDAYIAQLIELESDFYHNHLLPQVPPAIDGSKASEDALKVLFPEDDGSELTTEDPDAEDAILRYLDCKTAIGDLEKEKRKAANEIKALLGTAEGATVNGKYRATWKTIQRDAYEVKASSYRKLDVMEMSEEE